MQCRSWSTILPTLPLQQPFHHSWLAVQEREEGAGFFGKIFQSVRGALSDLAVKLAFVELRNRCFPITLTEPGSECGQGAATPATYAMVLRSIWER
jgi:hypothetical protein